MLDAICTKSFTITITLVCSGITSDSSGIAAAVEEIVEHSSMFAFGALQGERKRERERFIWKEMAFA